MASTHVYDLTSAKPAADKSAGAGGVEVSLAPDELDLVGDSSQLQRKYEETLRKQTHGGANDEDFSDMVAEHAARQKVALFFLSFAEILQFYWRFFAAEATSSRGEETGGHEEEAEGLQILILFLVTYFSLLK